MKKITIREIIKATGAQMIALGDMEEALNKEIWYVTQKAFFLLQEWERCVTGMIFCPSALQTA